MGMPVGLLISYVRRYHSISYRAAAKELQMPLSSLAEIEEFAYVPELKYAERIAAFLANHPVDLPELPPPAPAAVRRMLLADYAFRQMLPLFEHGLLGDDPLPSGPGTLLLVLRDIYLVFRLDNEPEEREIIFSFRAPADPVANRLVRHLFTRHWGASEKRRESGTPPLEFSAGCESAAVFKGPLSSWTEVFFPDRKPARRSHFAVLLLYVLTKHMALRFPPLAAASGAHHRDYVNASTLFDFRLFAPAGWRVQIPDIDEGLERMWHYNFGRSLFAPGDILVLHGPEGDVTLFGTCLASSDAFWVLLKGDWFSRVVRWPNPD